MGTRWIIDFDARLPSNADGDTWKVGISQAKFVNLQKYGHEARFVRLRLVEEVFNDTYAIFEGWSRPDTDGCFVYAGKPGRDYQRKGIQTPAPPGMIFLVFVLSDGTIDDWNWRPINSQDPTIPDGIKGRKIWPQT